MRLPRFYAGIVTVFLITLIVSQHGVFSQSTRETPTPSPTPEVGAFWQTEYNDEKKAYRVSFDWLSIPGVRGYAVEISKTPGELVTQKVDTIRSAWTFASVSPGDWYINLAAQKRNGSWTKVYYWKVKLAPPVLPTETPFPTPDDGEAVLGIRSSVESILNTLKMKQDAPPKEPTGKKYTCNCDKSCRAIFTCTEAYFQLNSCGCAHLDADEDGIPCENKCTAEE